MTDFASGLKERFDWAMYLSLEAYEVLADGRSFVRSDHDERAIGIFENLRDSVDAIAPPLVEAAEALRSGAPDLFEKTLSYALQAVGTEPGPASAADFVEILNRTVQRELPSHADD
jgi:hypothetical protein